MPTYKSEVKDSAIKEWTDAGFPPLNAVVHDSWTPNLLRNFLKKEMAVIGSPYAHVTPLQMEAIFCAVSAANSCELCLTFHAMGLEKHGQVRRISTRLFIKDNRHRKIFWDTCIAQNWR